MAHQICVFTTFSLVSKDFLNDSLGLTIYPFHVQDMESLIAAADEALLQTKEEGKTADNSQPQIGPSHPHPDGSDIHSQVLRTASFGNFWSACQQITVLSQYLKTTAQYVDNNVGIVNLLLWMQCHRSRKPVTYKEKSTFPYG